MGHVNVMRLSVVEAKKQQRHQKKRHSNQKKPGEKPIQSGIMIQVKLVTGHEIRLIVSYMCIVDGKTRGRKMAECSLRRVLCCSLFAISTAGIHVCAIAVCWMLFCT